MPTIEIKITNIAQIKAAFNKSPFLMINELNKAIWASALEISRDSSRLTPVDTGRLRASTYEKLGSLRAEIGTNTEYDVYVHEGTKLMRARPYLRKAVEQNNAGLNRRLRDGVQKVLDNIARST